MRYISTRTVGATLLGILSAVMIAGIIRYNPPSFLGGRHDEEVHVHADFLVYVNGERLDFTDDKYQSSEGAVRHFSTHLHDNNGHVIHRHAEGVTFADLFSSIGFELTEDCFTDDEGERFCTDEDNVLRLYVNGEIYNDPQGYIVEEEDRILLYYGAPDASEIDQYLEEIPSDACIASGTCPERGIPQPETCGATCEI